jgi:hypothetical protein
MGNRSSRKKGTVPIDVPLGRTSVILGSSQAGKTTFLKQLKYIFDNGFSPKECIMYRDQIWMNLGRMAGQISFAVISKYGTCTNKYVNEFAAQLQNNFYFTWICTPESVQQLVSIWNDPFVREMYERGAEYHLLDNMSYFFNDLDRIGSLTYVPTFEDILRLSARSTGITDATISIRDAQWTLIDVGGPRNERKKWVHVSSDQYDAENDSVSLISVL